MPFTQQKPTYLDVVRGSKLQHIMDIFDNPQKLPKGFTPSYDIIISLIDSRA